MCRNDVVASGAIPRGSFILATVRSISREVVSTPVIYELGLMSRSVAAGLWGKYCGCCNVPSLLLVVGVILGRDGNCVLCWLDYLRRSQEQNPCRCGGLRSPIIFKSQHSIELYFCVFEASIGIASPSRCSINIEEP